MPKMNGRRKRPVTRHLTRAHLEASTTTPVHLPKQDESGLKGLVQAHLVSGEYVIVEVSGKKDPVIRCGILADGRMALEYLGTLVDECDVVLVRGFAAEGS